MSGGSSIRNLDIHGDLFKKPSRKINRRRKPNMTDAWNFSSGTEHLDASEPFYMFE